MKVANDVSHKHVKSQFKMFFILNDTKMTKCEFEYSDFKMSKRNSDFVIFL
jgi:hypothetical protein